MREAKIEINVIVGDDLSNAEIVQRFRVLLSTGPQFRSIVVETVRAYDRFSGAYPQDRRPELQQPQQTTEPPQQLQSTGRKPRKRSE